MEGKKSTPHGKDYDSHRRRTETLARHKMTKADRRVKYTKLAREQSLKKRQRLEQQKLVCFHCRQRGHGINSCPQRDTTTATKNGYSKQQNKCISSSSKKCCYKCGSLDHNLSSCPHINKGGKGTSQDEKLPFATCFVCQKQGHLASQCPQNDKGIYVNGGACKTCGSKFHLSHHCPGKETQVKEDIDSGLPKLDDTLFDELLKEETNTRTEQIRSDEKSPTTKIKRPVPNRRIVKF